MDSEHTTLLRSTEIRWLSRGEVLVNEFLNFARKFILFFYLLSVLSFSLFGKYILAAEIGILSRHFYKNQ
jgi:hypothetical protein